MRSSLGLWRAHSLARAGGYRSTRYHIKHSPLGHRPGHISESHPTEGLAEQCPIEETAGARRATIPARLSPGGALSTLADVAGTQTYHRYGFLRAHNAARAKADARTSDGASDVGSLARVALREQRKVTLEEIRTSVGDVFGERPRSVGNKFCARLIATRAFSMVFIVNTLKMLGVERLDSLAVREIAARSTTCSNFMDQLRTIRLKRIRIDRTNFTTALEHFAHADERAHFLYVTQSDRHPETYDEPELQIKLVRAALATDRHADAFSMLATMVVSGFTPDLGAWNELLQASIDSERRNLIRRVVEDMVVNRIIVTNDSLYLLRDTFLGQRKKGVKPSLDPSALSFVTDIQLSVLDSGQFVKATHWIEIMKRLGMANAFDRLSSLCMHLASSYTRAPLSKAGHAPSASMGLHDDAILQSADPTTKYDHANDTLAILFRPAVQRAIIAWAIKAAGRPQKHESPPTTSRHLQPMSPSTAGHDRRTAFERGIRQALGLLRRLESGYGVVLDETGIRKEVRARLAAVVVGDVKAPRRQGTGN